VVCPLNTVMLDASLISANVILPEAMAVAGIMVLVEMGFRKLAKMEAVEDLKATAVVMVTAAVNSRLTFNISEIY
jgi:hypothetical protein